MKFRLSFNKFIDFTIRCHRLSVIFIDWKLPQNTNHGLSLIQTKRKKIREAKPKMNSMAFLIPEKWNTCLTYICYEKENVIPNFKMIHIFKTSIYILIFRYINFFKLWDLRNLFCALPTLPYFRYYSVVCVV